MMIFITHPKYFDEKKLDNIDKNVDIIYIFNGKVLFNKLKSRYNIVLLGRDYNIIEENFFSQSIIKNKYMKKILFDNKIFVYNYLNKLKRYTTYDDHYYKTIGYKQVRRLHIGIAKRNFEKDNNKGIETLDMYIKETILDIFKLDLNEEFVTTYSDNIKSILNLSNSLYRAYIQSLGYQRGIELLTEVNKYSYILNVMKNYKFNKWDIYKSGFKYDYLKVLSRLFIEHIHKERVKLHIENTTKRYKEYGWLW